jgi:hypothetical protein
MQIRTSHVDSDKWAVAGSLLIVGAGGVVALGILANQVGDLRVEVETKVTLASGKASYLPGAACVIAASPEQTPADIIHFARACAKSHELWLEEKTNEP